MNPTPLSSEDQKAIEAQDKMDTPVCDRCDGLGYEADEGGFVDCAKCTPRKQPLASPLSDEPAALKSAGSSPAGQNYICVSCKLVTNHKQNRCIQCGCQTHEPTAASVTYPTGSSPAERELQKLKIECSNFAYQADRAKADRDKAEMQAHLEGIAAKQYADELARVRERNIRLVECLQYFIMFTEGAKRFGIELENASMMAKAKAAIESEEPKP